LNIELRRASPAEFCFGQSQRFPCDESGRPTPSLSNYSQKNNPISVGLCNRVWLQSLRWSAIETKPFHDSQLWEGDMRHLFLIAAATSAALMFATSVYA